MSTYLQILKSIEFLSNEIDRELIEHRIKCIGARLDSLSSSKEKDELESMFIQVMNIVRP
jgi:hypothetical protein